MLDERDAEGSKALDLKKDLVEIIRWYDGRNPRASQTNIGPSELSSPCDRRIAYRLAGIQEINNTLDPWPAIVGTAVHSWLDSAVSAWIRTGHGLDWLTETKLTVGDWVTGRSDLFNVPRATVVDWKGVSADRMKQIQAKGSPENYRNQLHLYGLGYENRGYTVKRCALAYFPRSGLIKDLHVDLFDYDQDKAQALLRRIPVMATKILELDVLNNPHRWEQMESSPSHDCGFCPWYNFRRTPEEGASDLGCPGQ